jgi:hypothetical protein
MSEVAIRQDDAPVYAGDPTGGRLVAWAQAAHAANQLARSLSATDFCPAQFRGKAGEATAAIIAGDELGLPPLAALRSIYVVHGTPALYARTMRALALAHGHEMWTESATDAKVVVCGRRRGSDKVERREWTIQRATKAGYTNNKKYASNPQEMLQAKADAEVARLIAADVLAGTPYSVEDLELEDQPTVKVAARKVKRADVPEPEVEPEPGPEPEAKHVEAEQMITDAQSRKLHATLKDVGLVDRDSALAWMSNVIDVEIGSTRDLTKAQASQVIEALGVELQQQANAEVDTDEPTFDVEPES